MSKRHYKSTLERAKTIKAIVDRYYRPGNHRRSYRVIWGKYVNPVYPMTFRTFQTYLRVARCLDESPQEDKSLAPSFVYPLFDFWDSQHDHLGRVKP